jgi:hypothetical protein
VLVVRRRGDRQLLQIGSTLCALRCSSMNATITSVGGRTPPVRNMPTSNAGPRWLVVALDSPARSPSSASAQPGRSPAITLGSPHPLSKRLRCAPNLPRNRPDRRPLRLCTRSGAPAPSEPPALGLPLNTSSPYSIDLLPRTWTRDVLVLRHRSFSPSGGSEEPGAIQVAPPRCCW